MAVRSKNTLYVSGIDNSISESLLRDAFISFGNVKEVFRSETSGKDYAMITFEEEEDAMQAMDNMDGAVILGRCLRVIVAKQQRSGVRSGVAAWNSEQYLMDKHVKLPDVAVANEA